MASAQPHSRTQDPSSSPRRVQVTRKAQLATSGGQTEGMIRQNALVDVADGICASLMIAKPRSASAVHHHGAQDTVVYAAAGHGSIVSEGGAARVDLGPGDFALIPAYAEHQEVNDSDADVVWVITRSGRSPVVENLEGWSATKA